MGSRIQQYRRQLSGSPAAAFVSGFAPAYAPCVIEQVPVEGEEQDGGGWRSWFGLDRKKEEPAPLPQDPPAQQP